MADDLATPTGLEPATSAVTGRRSNQLSYGAIHGRIRETWCTIPKDRSCLAVPPTGFEPVLPP